MNYEILEALNQIAREKNMDRRMLLETLEAGLLSAVKKKYGNAANIEVVLDNDQGTVRVMASKKVVDDVEDPILEIDLEDAQGVDPEANVGQELTVEIPFEEFGRSAIQAAKQVVVQRLREAEREAVYDEYHDAVGEIVTGSVQQIDRGNLVVNLGRAEALLPGREQIDREQYRQGNTLRALILDVQKGSKGPQIVLSRTHPVFLKKLFELEVPEIYDGTVEIKAVAREPGQRAKIAVVSNDEKVDGVGACVGMKGSRVQAVVRELAGERIDIVPWSSNITTFVSKALSPARVMDIVVDEDETRMAVVVAEDQLSLAIGRGGQNARLAAKLTGWKIDLMSESEYTQRMEEEATMRELSLDMLPGVGERLAERLVSHGFDSVVDVDRAGAAELAKVPGIGAKTAEKLVAAAEEIVKLAEEKLAAIQEEKAQEAEAAALAEEELEGTAGEDEEELITEDEELPSDETEEEQEPIGEGEELLEGKADEEAELIAEGEEPPTDETEEEQQPIAEDEELPESRADEEQEGVDEEIASPQEEGAVDDDDRADSAESVNAEKKG